MSATRLSQSSIEKLAEMGISPVWVQDAGRLERKSEGDQQVASIVAPDGGHASGATVTGTELLDWDALQEKVAKCTQCGLGQSRTQTVFGTGSRHAEIMVVGEAPGAEEDAMGEPFVGQAGRLLDNMLAAVGLARKADVYIANVLKCRPPGNRNPAPAEVAQCEPYLLRQIALLRPKVILVLGRFAAQSLLASDASIGSLRGQVRRIELGGISVSTVVSYHPAYLLRTPLDKAKAWADLCLVRAELAKVDSA